MSNQLTYTASEETWNAIFGIVQLFAQRPGATAEDAEDASKLLKNLKVEEKTSAPVSQSAVPVAKLTINTVTVGQEYKLKDNIPDVGGLRVRVLDKKRTRVTIELLESSKTNSKKWKTGMTASCYPVDLERMKP